MDDVRSLLQEGCAGLNVNISDYQLDQLLKYKDLLIKWNKVFSLTAITNARQIVIQHLLDGISIVESFNGATQILDVGSGMGVPAIILAILLPNSNIVAIDSNSKKTSFLTQVKIELKLSNLNICNSRVEDYNANKFDVITSRAFANLRLFVDLTKHLLNHNGVFLAMKSELGLSELIELSEWNNSVIDINVPYLDAKRFLIKLNHK